MNTTHYKEALEKELSSLTEELKRVGRVNPDNPTDWEAVPEAGETENADSNIVADKFEDYEENTAVLKQLETRFNDVKDALARIEDGSYGTCEVCKKEIEEERLEANPAAKTCEEHMNN